MLFMLHFYSMQKQLEFLDESVMAFLNSWLNALEGEVISFCPKRPISNIYRVSYSLRSMYLNRVIYSLIISNIYSA